GHKRDNFCMDELSGYVEYVTYCPEMAVGLPAPRPSIRQIRKDDGIHVSRPDGEMDVTEDLIAYGQKIASQSEPLSGFIFCQKSPSCGMERVKVYQADGKGSTSDGVGLFAQQIMQQNPILPCEESGRLNDPALRENFVIRVFTYHAFQEMRQQGLTKHALIQFHSKRKYLLMSHHIESYKQAGRLLARADLDLETQAQEYLTILMTGLTHVATHRSHVNTLSHLQGYFKRLLTKEQKQELTQHIERFRQGLVPLLVPLTLIEHYLREHPQDYLEMQVYLAPYPQELKLRYI
ncbi:MAG: YbgA family protein, partial [Vibrio sp.]